MSILTKVRGLFGTSQKSSYTLDEYFARLQARGSAGERYVGPLEANQLSAVFACVRALSNTMSTIPFSLASVDDEGNKRLAKHHPVHRLLSVRPNPFQTPSQFKRYAMWCVLNYGDFVAFKVRDASGNVCELLPMRPGDYSITRDQNWRVHYHLSTELGSGVYTADDVFHFFHITEDSFCGVPVLKYARSAINQGLELQNQGTALVQNGLRTDKALTVPPGASTEGLKNLKKEWQELYTGTGNAGKVLWLLDGMDIKDLTISNEDAQFLQTRQYTRNEIGAFYGVPPHLAGDYENMTYSNVEQANLDYLQHGFLPWLNTFEEAARLQLLKPSEIDHYVVNGDENNLTRGDTSARTQHATVAVGRPYKTVNELRREEGLNPIAGGDGLAVQPGVGDGVASGQVGQTPIPSEETTP